MTGASERPARPPAPARSAAGRPGDAIVRASWIGTGLFAITAVVASAVPETDAAALVVALVLFVGGTVAFAAALVRAAGRSRHEELTMSGVFFLDGAPKATRRQLLGALAAEVVVAFATAGIRPNSSLAFGILAPVWGQGLAGLWGAWHGAFPPRAPRAPRAPRTVARPSGGHGDGRPPPPPVTGAGSTAEAPPA
ncbi:MAG TPA: hypothetical protein VHM89_08885 [Acidimicrobiales bacterium]|nr:hypothetical protein [Acidimicrobiales bacterium]